MLTDDVGGVFIPDLAVQYGARVYHYDRTQAAETKAAGPNHPDVQPLGLDLFA